MQQSETNRLSGIGLEAFQHGKGPIAMPRILAEAPRDLSKSVVVDLDRIVSACVSAFRDHSHLSNVLTHISCGNWGNVERAFRSILGFTVASRELSPLARNIVELLCADRGVTGRIMKPYFRDFLTSTLPPDQARRLGVHVTARFLELEMPKPFGALCGNVKNIAVVQGSSTASAQKVFQDVIERWSPEIRIAGAIEERNGADGRICRAGQMRSIADNTAYSMFQKAAPGTPGCDVENTGLNSAADAICRDVATGCDLVILSKFGKLEAAGQGLRAAFASSIEAKIPLLTYLPLGLYRAWERFASSRAVVLPTEGLAIDAWLRSLSTIRRAMTSFGIGASDI